MKNYIKGFFKYIFKKNVSILSLIDDKSFISDKSKVLRGCKLSNVNIGDYSYISKGSDINNSKIGRYCSIAPYVKIGFGIHPTNYLSTSPIFYNDNNVFGFSINHDNEFKEFKETNIGNDVWIGLNAIIIDGIKIGDGSIIGAGAVVTKDVEPYSIVGGVPAKLIRYRFNEEKIKRLLDTRWWDYEIYDIKKYFN